VPGRYLGCGLFDAACIGDIPEKRFPMPRFAPVTNAMGTDLSAILSIPPYLRYWPASDCCARWLRSIVGMLPSRFGADQGNAFLLTEEPKHRALRVSTLGLAEGTACSGVP